MSLRGKKNNLLPHHKMVSFQLICHICAVEVFTPCNVKFYLKETAGPLDIFHCSWDILEISIVLKNEDWINIQLKQFK